MSRNEPSAGFIIFRTEADRRLYLLLDYGRFWDYPKGHVEKGEDDLAAALRELHEETGLRDVELVEGFARELKYFFRKGKTLIRKTVTFFLARASTDIIQVSHEHAGHAWLPIDQALARVTYASSRKILEEAH